MRCTAHAKPQACPAASQNRRLNQSSTDTLIDTVIGGRLPGVLTLEMQVPQLRLLPEHNRVSAEMVANAFGPALQSSHTGAFEISFALRYEASDRSIRAHHLPAFQRHLAGALGQLVGLARIVGVLADRNGELAHAECSGLQGAGLVFSARGKIMVTLCNLGAGGRDLLRALAHLGHYLV